MPARPHVSEDGRARNWTMPALNGYGTLTEDNKWSNTVGKDIGFITAFNSVDTVVVSPMPSAVANAGTVDFNTALSLCKTQSVESRLPNIDELSALFINKNAVEFKTDDGNNFWSGTVVDSDHVMAISLNTASKYIAEKSGERYVRCIKR